MFLLRQTYPGTKTDTNLATLDEVQIQGLRFIGKGQNQQVHVRLSATLSHWTSVETLQLSQLMNTTRGFNTIQTKRSSRHVGRRQQSYLTRATTLLPEYNLPSSREKIATVAPQTLCRTAYQPTLWPHLVAKDATKADTENIGSSDNDDACVH